MCGPKEVSYHPVCGPVGPCGPPGMYRVGGPCGNYTPFGLEGECACGPAPGYCCGCCPCGPACAPPSCGSSCGSCLFAVYKVVLFLFLYSVTRVEGDQNFTIFKPYANACQNMPVKKIVGSLSSFAEIQTALSGYLNASKTLAILLDYDGTLAPLVPNPNNTAMPEELETTVRKLAVHPKIFMAVISGRGLSDVKKTVGIPGITYAGNHGIEIEFPDGSRHDYQLPEKVQEAHKKLVNELNEKLNKHNAWIEDKKFSLTYHYRGTPAEVVESIKAEAIQIIEKHGFRANLAHEAIEAKPPVNWNKGEAACYILKKKFGENFSTGISIVFVGDDTTDEDAMRALQGIGKTFRISDNTELETFADYRLTKQAVVTDLMKWVANTYTS